MVSFKLYLHLIHYRPTGQKIFQQYLSTAVSVLKYNRHLQVHYSPSRLRHGSPQKKPHSKELAEEVHGPKEITLGGKVAEAGKTASYMGVMLLGAGVIGFMVYLLGRELFSSESPNGVYTKALKECVNHYKVIRELGEPIKGHGEMTKRGRARYVSHMEFEREGVKHMRVNFYLKGSMKRAVAQAEVRQNDKGKYDFRYILLETEEMPSQTIIVLDNR